MEYSIIDILLIVPLLIGLIRGFMKGFLVEIAMIVGLVVGVWAGYTFSDIVNEWLKTVYDFEMKLAGFAICFIVVLISLYLLAKTLEKALKLIAMGWLNKIAGSIFGLIKWILILSVILIFFNKINGIFHLVSKEELNKSILFAPIQDIGSLLLPILNDLEIDSDWTTKLDSFTE